MNIITTRFGSTVFIYTTVGRWPNARSQAVATIHVPPEEVLPPSRLLRWVADELERPVLDRYIPRT